MVLIATISKASVHCQMPNLWNIAMHLNLKDAAVVVIDRDYTARFRTGDTIASKAPELIKLMQADIDQYKGEKAIYSNAELAKLATTVKAALNVEAALEA